MKHFCLILLAILFCQQGFSQDLLYTKNRGLLKVKVTEVSDALIKYKLFGLREDVSYSTTKKLVDSIVFENGLVERFTKSRQERFRGPAPHEKFKYEPKHERLKSNTDEELRNAFSNQVAAGIWAFGNSMGDGPMVTDSNPFRNEYAAAIFVRYKTDLFRKRVSLNLTPFVGMNKKTYGGAIGATFNIKRFGKFTFGVGPEYILSVQDIVERFYHSSGEEYFNYYKKYNSAVSIVTFNTNMNMFVRPNLSITADVGVGGVVGSSKRRDNMISPKDGYYKSGTIGSFKLGVGYWF